MQHLKDECVFTFPEVDAWVVASTHVDDIFTLANEAGESLRKKIKAELIHHMTVDDQCEISWALDTKIERDAEREILTISQKGYIESLLADYQLSDSKGVDTPMISRFKIEECDLPRSEEDIKEVENFPHQKIIGSLWWLAGISRPDICMATHYAATWSAKRSIK